MTRFRRYFRPVEISFLTHITYQRKRILTDNFDLLWQAIETSKTKTPFELIAWVILPDHMHFLIDPGQIDVSNLIRRIKLSFSYHYRKQAKMSKGRIWQYRFWDHIIRSRDDLNRYMDYIHFNPVKHQLVKDPFKYKYSSLSEYFRNGYYSRDWGVVESFRIEGDFGE